LRTSFADDAQLLEQGMSMFEALYQSLQPRTGMRGGKTKIFSAKADIPSRRTR